MDYEYNEYDYIDQQLMERYEALTELEPFSALDYTIGDFNDSEYWVD
jgi:hypothetical protein